MVQERGAGEDRRAHSPRYPIVARVRVRLETWAQFEPLYTANVSTGGIFVEMANPPRTGAKLSIEVTDTVGRTVVLPGLVVHDVPESRSRGRAGIGVQFLELSEVERIVIDALIDEARAGVAAGSGPLPEREVASKELWLRAQLEQMQQASPYDVLGLPPMSTENDARRALLMQVKRFEPSNFADQPEHIRQLSVEICRMLRTAYLTVAAASR